MMKFKLESILFYLPIFFFVLSGSPNIVGWRIGVTIGIFALLIPLSNYMAYRLKEGRNLKASIADLAALLLIIAAYFLAMKVNYSLILVSILFTLLSASKKDEISIMPLVVNILKGGFLFAVVYFGLNQYGFQNLLKLHVSFMALVSIILYLFLTVLSSTHDNYNRKEWIRFVGVVLSLTILSLIIYLGSLFSIKYVLYLIIILVPAGISYYYLATVSEAGLAKLTAWVKRFRISSVIALTIFLIYFFLDSTQVLQAVMGGY